MNGSTECRCKVSVALVEVFVLTAPSQGSSGVERKRPRYADQAA